MAKSRKNTAVVKGNVSGYLPNDQPPPVQMALLGFQHVLTMFPATVLVAALCGFHVGTVLTVSGVGTVVALLLAKWRLGKFIPLFYGSSFSYIAAYLAIAQQMTGALPQFGVPLPDEVISTMQAGIVVTGLLNIGIGFLIRYGPPADCYRFRRCHHRLWSGFRCPRTDGECQLPCGICNPTGNHLVLCLPPKPGIPRHDPSAAGRDCRLHLLRHCGSQPGAVRAPCERTLVRGSTFYSPEF
jgi:hypothetical protein